MTGPVVIDGGCWANERGFGRFTRCLIAEIAKQRGDLDVRVVVERQRGNGRTFPAGITIEEIEVTRPPSEAAADGGSRSVRDLLRFTRAVARMRASAVYFPATYTYFPVVGAKTAVTVHDAMAEAMPDLMVPRRRDRLRWTLKQQLALRRADTVFSVSQEAADQVHRVLGVGRDRLRVLGEAPDPVFRILSRPKVEQALHAQGRTYPYVLYVGGFGPHKNVAGLIGAFDLMAGERDGLELVMVGSLDDPFLASTLELRCRIEASPYRSRIALTGFVSDIELCVLYNGAVVTALPSLAEGFGLTAIESAACGTPVVANHLPSVREFLGDAAVYVDATDASALAEGLRRVTCDPVDRARRSALGSTRAAEHTWAAPARDVLQVMRRLAGERT